ncbi:cytochrome c family protein [Pseudoroseomonas rhizosphaerae]|uniref:Cytochrome c family protein n=1 Tax=Teichococcus rhizosphaerae TaxID=1335062 RepID=A0A2C7A7Q9_9PROT|nr:cytochrome c family protein [Pseudoroseomonas rhizosphaerae]PHK93385.1 cytochrome c family protein [Pseudoroseomonas rhizosphaerae]
MIRYIAPFASLMALALAAAPVAAQDAEAGQRAFNQCRACHTINEGARSGVGPNLHGVIGRKAASLEGFRYSKAMQDKGAEGLVWNEESLNPYLRSPREVVPGTTMSFPGLKDEKRLQDLLAYLKQQS